ncbi:hypothetical protein [Bacillus cihuensis]|uniref:hypothetical protein n=1 Tax=Bacillus cihuensis TaxID=1208599 RepID=UPI00040DDA17|nr:hypothetical protein [Bacillus cihuensis]
MKQLFSLLMIVGVSIFIFACSSQTKSELEMKSDNEKDSIESKPNVEVKTYKEPLTQVGENASHPFGVFVLNQLSKPNMKITAGPLYIQVERIKIVQSTDVSDIGKYNLKEKGLNTGKMNIIQLTTTLENTSDQPLYLEKGPIKTLVLSNGEQVNVNKMNVDPKDLSLKAKEKTEFTLICFLSQDPKNLKYVKVITDIVREQVTKKEVSPLKTVEIKM